VVRSLALTWLMHAHGKTDVPGDPVPKLMEAARKERSAGVLERFASRLVLGHLLAYNSPTTAAAAAEDASEGPTSAAEVASRTEQTFLESVCRSRTLLGHVDKGGQHELC
jgi:hypothetical protein